MKELFWQLELPNRWCRFAWLPPLAPIAPNRDLVEAIAASSVLLDGFQVRGLADTGPTLRQVVELARLGLPLTAAVRATHRSHNGSAGIGPAHRSIRAAASGDWSRANRFGDERGATKSF